jgi:hypothetical protein
MADVIGQRLAGNIVYIDKGAHLRRVVDAIGPDVFKYLNDFMRGPGLSATAIGDDMTVTATGTSPVIFGDGAGGMLLITTGGTENDGVNIQALGENFHLGATGIRALYFGARFKISEATQSDFFIGLCDTDTDILGGADDSIGFRKADASAAVSFVTEKGTTETTAAAFTAVADTWYIAEFYYDADAGTLEVFVNGASIGTVATTNLPDEEQRVSVAFLTGDTAAETMTIDWINVVQVGGRLAA